MKKVIKHPDGREETVEGTAEEIAEYERKLREGGRSKSKKPVLHGAPEVDGKPLTDAEVILVRLSRAGILPKEKEQVFVPMPAPIVVPEKYWLQDVPCRWCGQLGCQQMHIICDNTVTVTDASIPDNIGYLTSLTCSYPSTSLSDMRSFGGLSKLSH